MCSWVALLCCLKRVGISRDLRHFIFSHYIFPFEWETYVLRLQRVEMHRSFQLHGVYKDVQVELISATLQIAKFVDDSEAVSECHNRTNEWWSTGLEIILYLNIWCHIVHFREWTVEYHQDTSDIDNTLELSNDTYYWMTQGAEYRHRLSRPRTK
jgi:hypothetical protein